MKQFVKALDHDGECFRYICSTFPGLSDEKKNAGIFDSPQIRTLLRDAAFATTMTVLEVRAWNAFSDVAQNFLGTGKPGTTNIVQELLDSFHSHGCRMSIKLHYLHSHLRTFPVSYTHLRAHE